MHAGRQSNKRATVRIMFVYVSNMVAAIGTDFTL